MQKKGGGRKVENGLMGETIPEIFHSIIKAFVIQRIILTIFII